MSTQSTEQEYIERLNQLANNAASSIFQNRDSVKRELSTAEDLAKHRIDELKKAARHYQGHAVNLAELGKEASRIRSEMDLLSSMLVNVRKDAGDVSAVIGNVVRLKSNTAVLMTAAALDDDGRIVCSWMNGSEYTEASIPLAALELANPPKTTATASAAARKRAAK